MEVVSLLEYDHINHCEVVHLNNDERETQFASHSRTIRFRHIWTSTQRLQQHRTNTIKNNNSSQINISAFKAFFISSKSYFKTFFFQPRS